MSWYCFNRFQTSTNLFFASSKNSYLVIFLSVCVVIRFENILYLLEIEVICILVRVQDNANICILGIFRVFGDISSYHLHILHCKIMIVSHVTYLFFHGDCTNNYECPEGWDVRKILVTNCGQCYTLFSLWHDRKKYSCKMKFIDLG